MRPEEALYVGDLYEVDVVGARAAGIEPVLLAHRAPVAGQSTAARAASLGDLVERRCWEKE